MLREALALPADPQPAGWRRPLASSLLGECLLGRHRFAEAEPLLVAGFEGIAALASSVPPRDRPLDVPEAGDRVVRLYLAWGKPEEADAWRARTRPDLTLPLDPFAP